MTVLEPDESALRITEPHIMVPVFSSRGNQLYVRRQGMIEEVEATTLKVCQPCHGVYPQPPCLLLKHSSQVVGRQTVAPAIGDYFAVFDVVQPSLGADPDTAIFRGKDGSGSVFGE